MNNLEYLNLLGNPVYKKAKKLFGGNSYGEFKNPKKLVEYCKHGVDKVNVVQRNKEMWKDYINSLYQKSLILEEMDVDSLYYSNYTIVIKNYLNILVESVASEK